jgi:hypothetical protein
MDHVKKHILADDERRKVRSGCSFADGERIPGSSKTRR